MADRIDIRKAAYGEMESAISGLSFVGADDISQSMPDSLEELPRVVHNDNYREVPMNDASEGPHEVITDSNGDDIQLVFYTMMEAQFEVTVVHDNETEKETIYEMFRRHFEKYTHGFWDEDSIHPDVHQVSVTDSTSDDDDDREPVARGDVLRIRLGYKRDYRVVREGAADQFDESEYDDTYAGNIEQVDHELDVDNDGTTDETYTTQ